MQLCVRSERVHVLLDHLVPQQLRLRLSARIRRVRSYVPSMKLARPRKVWCHLLSSLVNLKSTSWPRTAQLTTASNQAYVNSTGATATFSGNRFYLAYNNNGDATMYPYMTFDWKVRAAQHAVTLNVALMAQTPTPAYYMCGVGSGVRHVLPKPYAQYRLPANHRHQLRHLPVPHHGLCASGLVQHDYPHVEQQAKRVDLECYHRVADSDFVTIEWVRIVASYSMEVRAVTNRSALVHLYAVCDVSWETYSIPLTDKNLKAIQEAMALSNDGKVSRSAPATQEQRRYCHRCSRQCGILEPRWSLHA